MASCWVGERCGRGGGLGGEWVRVRGLRIERDGRVDWVE